MASDPGLRDSGAGAKATASDCLCVSPNPLPLTGRHMKAVVPCYRCAQAAGPHAGVPRCRLIAAIGPPCQHSTRAELHARCNRFEKAASGEHLGSASHFRWTRPRFPRLEIRELRLPSGGGFPLGTRSERAGSSDSSRSAVPSPLADASAPHPSPRISGPRSECEPVVKEVEQGL